MGSINLVIHCDDRRASDGCNTEEQTLQLKGRLGGSCGAHRIGVEGLQDDGRAGAVGVGGPGAEGVALLQAAVDEGEVLGGGLVRRRALADARAEERVRVLPQKQLRAHRQHPARHHTCKKNPAHIAGRRPARC